MEPIDIELQDAVKENPPRPKIPKAAQLLRTVRNLLRAMAVNGCDLQRAERIARKAKLRKFLYKVPEGIRTLVRAWRSRIREIQTVLRNTKAAIREVHEAWYQATEQYRIAREMDDPNLCDHRRIMFVYRKRLRSLWTERNKVLGLLTGLTMSVEAIEAMWGGKIK